MMHDRIYPRTLVFVVAALILPAAFSAGLIQQERPRPSVLFKDSRQMLAIARAQGRSHVTLLIAASAGEGAAVARHAEAVGGEVRFRQDAVGYVRVRVPIDRASELAESEGIESVALDYATSDPHRLSAELQGEQERALRPQGQDPVLWPPEWGDYPLRHPYSPLRNIDAAEFLAEHPTFDGRGITIALLDGNFDFLLPEFQTAYTLDGTPTSKVADYLNVTDPRVDADDVPQWVDMREQVIAQNGSVTFGGKTFTTPYDGEFRIGFFDERRFNNPANAAYMDQDVDRNGNPRGDDGLFGVLWDEVTNEVWVDTNRDLSFADQEPMTDYIERQDAGIFGTDDPETPVRESIGFTVQTDAENKFVSINVGIYQHATEIMGTVVGNREPNGRLQGIAPGARLVSIFWGVKNAHGLIEGLIAAFKHPLTDLVVLEQDVRIASLPYLLADGRHPISIIARRLIEGYQKPLFVPGGNSPGLGIVAEDGLAPAAISVGGYQHRDSYLINNGFEPEPADNLQRGALAHGPSGNGALKPDLLAPSGLMSTDIGYVYRKRAQELRGLYQLPPGYRVVGGTSTATPMAAGAAALVLSAAKQTNVPYDAVRLKAALAGSARYIPRLAAHEQGSGLVQVRAAYELLKAMDGAALVTISSRAPVHTRLSPLLATPNTGPGLYEREGWSVGGEGTRTITFTRTSGPAEPMTFTARWEGNDGSFRSAPEVTLPLNIPVDFQVDIAIDTPGAHSAILVLEHPSIPGPAHKVLNTVIAALPLSAKKGYTVTEEIMVPRPGDRGVFIEVPPGAAALRFSATSEDSSSVRLRAILPGRRQVNPCPRESPSTVAPVAGEPCTVANPEPGVWEINASYGYDLVREFDPGRPRPVPPARVAITASLLGVDVSVASARVDAASVATNGITDMAAAISPAPDGTADLPVTVTNRFGATAAALTSGQLGSAYRTMRTIAQGEQHVYEVIVPKGATGVYARVTEVSDPDADLDIYLIDCTLAEREAIEPPLARDKENKAPPPPPPSCAPRAKAATVDTGGEVVVHNPAPGRWVVVVDGYAVAGGSTTYSYLDLFTHPRYGAISVTNIEEQRQTGATWTGTAHVWAAAQPDAGRILWARLLATSRNARTADGSPIALGALDIPLVGAGARGGIAFDMYLNHTDGYQETSRPRRSPSPPGRPWMPPWHSSWALYRTRAFFRMLNSPQAESIFSTKIHRRRRAYQALASSALIRPMPAHADASSQSS